MESDREQGGIPEERQARIQSLVLDYLREDSAGGSSSAEDILAAHPELLPELGEELRKAQLLEAARARAGGTSQASAAVQPTVDASSRERPISVRCPNCRDSVELVTPSTFVEIQCSTCGSRFSLVDTESATRRQATITQVAHYELKEQVGCGAFGAVWKARDIELDRTVAVKIPHAEKLGLLDVEKFLREARAGAQLNHPNIVAVHEVGRQADTLYITSDFVRGVSLAGWLTAKHPTPVEAARLCLTIARAVHHAHEAGVIHRDLKPGNIMVDANGEPHIMDFGLAKRETGEITLTTDGVVLGTPGYMPPEQALGQGHLADRRSDIYSVGVILFELLTGALPFRGSTEMVIYQIVHEPPTPLRKMDRRIPRDLETIALKCLEKEPRRRFQTAADLAEELQRFLDGAPIRSRPIGLAARSWRWCKRKPAVASLAATSIGFALVLFATVVIMLGRSERLRNETNDALQMAHNALAAVIPEIGKDEQLFNHSEKVLLHLVEHYRHQSDVTEEARARNTLGIVYKNHSDFAEAIEHLENANQDLSALRKLDDQTKRLQATIRMNLANALRQQSREEGNSDFELQISLLESTETILSSLPAGGFRQALTGSFRDNLARTLNLRAWHKATNPAAALRNGEQAVADATAAADLGLEKVPSLDTLAAALAETGDFDKAVHVQEQAIAAQKKVLEAAQLQALKILQKSSRYDAELRQRLRKYKKRQPHREPARRAGQDHPGSVSQAARSKRARERTDHPGLPPHPRPV